MTAIVALRRALAAVLLALCLAAPPAVAQDWAGSDDPAAPWAGDEQPGDDQSGDDPPPWTSPPPAPAVPAPAVQQPLDPWVPEPPVEVPLVTTRTVAGTVAMLRTDGKAAIPRGAPAQVRAIIASANLIAGKPYKWGGGHAKLVDRGYDCSGTVSFALIRAGLLAGPLVSGSFSKWGAADAGRWVTIYANRGHVYMEVAGLRLDTSPAGDPGGRSGVRWRPALGRMRGFHVRHPEGL